MKLLYNIYIYERPCRYFLVTKIRRTGYNSSGLIFPVLGLWEASPNFEALLSYRIIFDMNMKILWLMWSSGKALCDFYLRAIYLAEIRIRRDKT